MYKVGDTVTLKKDMSGVRDRVEGMKYDERVDIEELVNGGYAIEGDDYGFVYTDEMIE